MCRSQRKRFEFRLAVRSMWQGRCRVILLRLRRQCKIDGKMRPVRLIFAALRRCCKFSGCNPTEFSGSRGETMRNALVLYSALLVALLVSCSRTLPSQDSTTGPAPINAPALLRFERGVRSIFEDSKGNLWFTSPDGACRYDPSARDSDDGGFPISRKTSREWSLVDFRKIPRGGSGCKTATGSTATMEISSL